MDSNKYLEEMKKVQESILYYLDEDNNIEEKYQTLETLFNDIQIHSIKFKISSLMHLLLQISSNHHREENFFSKIEEILLIFKNNLTKHYSNSELFNIFKSNKRILLFLIEEKVLNFDEFIAKRIIQYKYLENNYPQYFQPEIKPFMNDEWFQKEMYLEDLMKEIPSDFYEKEKLEKMKKKYVK